MSDKQLRDHHQNDNRGHLVQWYPRQNRLFRKIKKTLSVWSKILEIGFGDGYLLNKLSHAGYLVFWQDLSKKNIELTQEQRNNPDIKFFLWDDSWNLLVPDNSLDWFVASEVLEHMNDAELDICVSEIYRSLKKWGMVFITVPVKEDLQANECICPECWEVFHKRWHKQYRDEQKIKETFNKFQITKIEESFVRYVGKGVLDNLIWYVLFIIRNLFDKVTPLGNKTYFLMFKKL